MRCAVFALSVFLAVIGNYRAEEALEFALAEKTFRSGDLEVKMLDSGVAEVYVEGRFLARTYSDLESRGVFRFSQPEISSDEKNGELTMIFRQKKDTLEMTCVRKLKAVKGVLELTTELTSSAEITPFDVPVRMSAADYDGGTWQFGPEGLSESIMAKTDYFTSENIILRTDSPEVKDLSFWQKGRRVGFSVSNVKGNETLLVNWWDGWWQKVKPASPKMYYTVRMYSDGDKKIQRVTQSIAPAYRTDNDILAEARAAHVRVDFSVAERHGYIPVGCRFPVQITIAGSKETAGSYVAEFLLSDQGDREVMKKAMSFDVTETEGGKLTFNFVTPQQCALYWMRIRLRDKNGSLLYSKEYPFAAIVKLPDLKDIPATSPLGGQPLAGGAMPEGRFVGMKWDRFWCKETDWDTIEPEKGKFNWEGADRMVEEAVKAGNEILWCLCKTPNWASKMPLEKIYDAIAAQYPVSEKLKLKVSGAATDSPGYDTKRIPSRCPPRDIKDWEDFVRAIVRRYKAKVHYWQVWNEPWWDKKRYGKPVGDVILQLLEENGKVAGADAWGFSGTPEDYAALVKSASRIIHEEDPNGKVVAYGDYEARDSTEEFYKTGVGDYIDVLSVHYFYLDYISDRKNIPGGRIGSSATATNNIVRDQDLAHFKHTGKHVPVWNTEEGWYKCSQQGRHTSRPLSQKECEERYGERARKSTALSFQAATGRAMISERLNAVWETESLLCSLGYGMEKVFLHSGHSVSVWGGTVGFRLPTEKGIAWAAMASVLSTSKEVKYSPIGNKDLDAVTITDISGKKTAVIWSHTGERKISVGIPVSGGKVFDFFMHLVGKTLIKGKTFKGMDWLGNLVDLKAENGWLTVEAGEEPLYIHDLDLTGVFISGKKFISIKTGDKDKSALQVGKPYHGEVVVCNPYAGRSIDGVLEAFIKPGGKIIVIDEGKIKLAPGEQKTVPFNIMVEGGEEVQVEFVLKDQGAEWGRLKKTYSIARYQKGTPLPKCPRTIKMDGELGDWDGMAEHKVDTAGRVLVGLETPVYESAPVRIWKGPSDLSFSVKSCWREDGLYFLVEVNDNEITPGPEPSCQWDCVEFFVDVRDAAGQAKKEKTPGAVQFSVQPCLNDAPKECKISFAGDDGKYAKALFMGRKTKTGYVVEGKVEPVGIQLKEGMPIGLDVAVDDGKEPNPGNKAERKSQVVWMGTQDNYKDTSKWGKFYLGK